MDEVALSEKHFFPAEVFPCFPFLLYSHFDPRIFFGDGLFAEIGKVRESLAFASDGCEPTMGFLPRCVEREPSYGREENLRTLMVNRPSNKIPAGKSRKPHGTLQILGEFVW